MSRTPMPVAFDFTDYRDYLSAWFDEKKRQTPGYTLSRFANKAGCSRGHLQNILSKERPLSPPLIDKFSTLLGHPRDEGEFFITQVRYAHTKDPFEKASLLQQMVGRLVIRGSPVTGTLALVALMDLRHMAIYEAAFSDLFEDDPHWVARKMKMLPEEAAESLGALKAAGLLVKGADGRFRPVRAVQAPSPGTDHPSLYRLHDEAICAARAASRNPAGDRRFFVLTGPTTEQDLQALRAMAGDFAARTDTTLAQMDSSKADRVYAVQVHLLPAAEAGL